MAKLAFFSSVASLSFAATALLALNGMPAQRPMSAAGLASALVFGALAAGCRLASRARAPRAARAPSSRLSSEAH